MIYLCKLRWQDRTFAHPCSMPPGRLLSPFFATLVKSPQVKRIPGQKPASAKKAGKAR